MYIEYGVNNMKIITGENWEMNVPEESENLKAVEINNLNCLNLKPTLEERLQALEIMELERVLGGY